MEYRGRRLYGVCCAEKGVFRFTLSVEGVAGHASIPRMGDNALSKLAPLLARMHERQPSWDVTPEPAALLCALERGLPLPEVRTLVAALERSRRHGAPLGETLAAQAREARFALARRVREEAARAGPKIQLVVALLLVPSVLLLVAAALAAALLNGRGTALPI
jgi:tight adherence protein C